MLDKQDRYLKRVLSAVENTEKNTAAILKELKKSNREPNIVIDEKTFKMYLGDDDNSKSENRGEENES